jgi:hypothetical protein
MRLAVDRPSGVTPAVVLYVRGRNADNEWKMQHKTLVGHHGTSMDSPDTSSRQLHNAGGGYFVCFLQEVFYFTAIGIKVTQKRPVCFASGICQIGNNLQPHISEREIFFW